MERINYHTISDSGFNPKYQSLTGACGVTYPQGCSAVPETPSVRMQYEVIPSALALTDEDALCQQ